MRRLMQSTFTAAAFVVALTGSSISQEESRSMPEMPEFCSVTAEGKIIQIVVCDPTANLEQAVLIQVGQAACGDRLPCGAWIWTNGDDAPTAAPGNHDGLTQAQITSSKGVWVAEQKSFILIDEVK